MTRRRTFEIPEAVIHGAVERDPGRGDGGGRGPLDGPSTPGRGASTAPPDGADGRPGPMSAAIRDAAAANNAVAQDMRAAEMRSLELAVELQRLRRNGRVVELVALEEIETDHLNRDRTAATDDGLAELRASIEAHGLSNPVRLERRDDGRFNLIEGWRRLLAYRAMAGSGRSEFATIPALVDAPLAVGSAYRRMVDENLVREDVSFAEHARLAIAYASDARVGASDVDGAVGELFASVNKQTRSEIRQFTRVIAAVGDLLLHERAIGRALARELGRALNEGRSVEALRKALDRAPGRGASEEIDILRRWTERKARPGAVAARRPASRTVRFDLGARRVTVRLNGDRIVIDGVDVAGLDEETVLRALEALTGDRRQAGAVA
jgi:ParB family chromosome partitioning protein